MQYLIVDISINTTDSTISSVVFQRTQHCWFDGKTTLTTFPWFSPAGQQRGIINNAIKLAYNPSKSQRDLLYTQRINPVITKSGTGTMLFGDKTGLAYASAFDRINVRRLFLTVEQALRGAGEAQLFELNDEITRANFVNIVEPYLRDIQAKRGLYDFLVICDASTILPISLTTMNSGLTSS